MGHLVNFQSKTLCRLSAVYHITTSTLRHKQWQLARSKLAKGFCYHGWCEVHHGSGKSQYFTWHGRGRKINQINNASTSGRQSNLYPLKCKKTTISILVECLNCLVTICSFPVWQNRQQKLLHKYLTTVKFPCLSTDLHTVFLSMFIFSGLWGAHTEGL